MKNKTKLFLSFLTIGLFTIISGCSEDYEITEHNHTHDGYTIKNYSYKQASKLSKFQKANKIAKQELNLKFSNLKTFKNSKLKKSVERDKSISFAIDSTLIKEVTKDDVTTYTMLVALDTVDYSDNSFDNLIIKVDSQNNTSSYIIHYTPTSETVYNATHNSYTFQGNSELSKVYGITTFGGGGGLGGNGNIDVDDYDGSEAGSGVNTWDSVICVTLIKCNYSYPHIAGPGCANTYSETFCYTNPNYNPWSGGGNSPEEENPLEGDNSNSGGGGGSTSNSNTTNDTGETSTITIMPEEIVALDTDLIKTPAQIEREKGFRSNLTLQQKIWLSNHDDIEDDVFEYLESQITDPLNIEYSNESEEFAVELIDLATLETNQELANKITTLSLMFETSDDIFTEEFGQSLFSFTEINPSHIPPDYPLVNLSISTFLKYKQLRQLNPDWSKAKCIWYATKEMVHIGLDVFGMVPLIGEPTDILNGVLYTIEGDGLNATLSYAGAVPLVGWAATGVKYAIKINEVATIGTKIKLVWKVASNGVIQFGSRNQLRKVLGMGTSAVDPRQAHHLIPWSSQSKMAVQRAAQSGSAFHMNEALNGIPVAAWRNQPNHQTYNNVINAKLDNYRDLNPNATPQECYDFLTDLIEDIRTWVINNPNSHLNDIILP